MMTSLCRLVLVFLPQANKCSICTRVIRQMVPTRQMVKLQIARPDVQFDSGSNLVTGIRSKLLLS